MKRLLKILFVFVIAWFASIGVKAQILEPLAASADRLELTVSSPDVNFTFEYGKTVAVQTTAVTISASANWKLLVTTTATQFTSTTSTEVFPLNKVSLTGLITGTFGGACEASGFKNQSGNIYWNLANIGNVYEGKYSAPVTFTLVKK
jgi:hypothetical protein